MRWKHIKDFPPPSGTQRVVKRFLLLPKKLNGEYRWLCTVEILQEFYHAYSCTGWDYSPEGWFDVGWSDLIESAKRVVKEHEVPLIVRWKDGISRPLDVRFGDQDGSEVKS